MECFPTVESQYLLGAYYFYGDYVDVDRDKALCFYTKAVFGGHKKALSDLITATRVHKGRFEAFKTWMNVMIELMSQSYWLPRSLRGNPH